MFLAIDVTSGQGPAELTGQRLWKKMIKPLNYLSIKTVVSVE